MVQQAFAMMIMMMMMMNCETSCLCQMNICCVVLCRSETIRSALEVLAVCTVIPKAQLQLCEQVRQPDADPVPAIRFCSLDVLTCVLS